MKKVYCVVYHPAGDLAIIEGVFEKMKDAESVRKFMSKNAGDYVEIVEMKVE